MSADTATTSLKHTPLHALHLELGARMVPFAGYEMPVQYPMGVLKEHLHTRAAAGLFDVSHMGQIVVHSKSGDARDAARAIERLVPVDILGLAPGRLRYTFFTNAHGGILDDLMVANCGNHLLLVVNAACKAADEAHLRAELGNECEVERLDRALIALQGPKAEVALAQMMVNGTGGRRDPFTARALLEKAAQRGHDAAMSALKKVVPVSHIVFGTDFPWISAAETAKGIKDSGVFTAEEIAQIDSGNALQLFPKYAV